jgi:hypothetical protein
MAVFELDVLPSSEVWRLCCSGRSPINQFLFEVNVIIGGWWYHSALKWKTTFESKS